MISTQEFKVSNKLLEGLYTKRIVKNFHPHSGYLGWQLIFLFLLLSVVGKAQLKVQGVSSGGHNSTGSTVKLSGSFGVPFAHSSTPTLKGGIIGSSSGLLIENFPPTISFDVVTSFQFTTPQSIVATVTDPTDGVEYSAMWIRPIGGTTFDSLTLTKGVGDNYSVSIPSNKIDKMGFEYYLTARDLTLKRGRLPISGSYYAYAEIEKPSVPNERLKPGSKKEDYRMITVPYTIGTNSITQLFDELGTQDKTKWRLFSHEGGEVFKEFPLVSSLEPGKGYWLLVKEDHYQTLELSDTYQKSPAYNQTQLFEITLKPGWNLIGNPYTVPIDWSDIQDYNSGVQVEDLKRFTGTYSNSDVLEPFEGGFVHLDGSVNKTIKISFSGQVNSGGRKGSPFSADISSENWKLNLDLRQGDRLYTLGGIGMHKDASSNKDRYDDHNPPRFQSYLEVNFSHPEHSLGSFCRDIVPTQDKYNWTFTVDASDQSPVFLQWDNQEMGDNDIGLYLYETGSASLVNMRHVNSHQVTQHSPIQIFYGAENITPEVAVAGQAFPNPLNTSTSKAIVFPIALPSSVSDYQVHVEILDGRGMHIKDVLKEKLLPGFYEARWQVDDEQGKLCTPGMYVYRVSLSRGGGSLAELKTITGKLIITN